jgi:ADP-ribosyl-[dinitrogen reductase] hydrolase
VLDWREPGEPSLPTNRPTLSDLDAARALRDRYPWAGCSGLACGDALGATLQFRASNQFPQVTDMLGGGHWSLQPGAWTDDTAMALCLADSLLEMQDCAPADQVQRYRRWQRQGHLSSTGQCIAITAEVAAVLAGATPAACPSAQALSRTAAVALYCASSPERAFDWTVSAAQVTDRSEGMLDACQCFVGYLLAAVRGATLSTLHADALELLSSHVQAGAGAIVQPALSATSASRSPAPSSQQGD